MRAASNPTDRDAKTPSTLAPVADVLAVALCAAAVAVFVTGGLSFRTGVFHVSVRTPWRPLLAGFGVLAVRCWTTRQLPTLAGIAGLFTTAWGACRRFARELPLDESALFGRARSLPRRAGGFALLVLSFSIVVAGFTWPQVRHLHSVADLADPLFSIWRLAWVNHQLLQHPLRLFDGNIFYPERLTLTYSDPALVPALMAAPLFWLGVHQVVIYNLVLLSGFVLSGAAMFLLVRALTGQVGAASIAGVIFALYPYRFEHYAHLELQMTMWMPLALWGLHRTLARGRLRDGLGTGLAFALQSLSSLYYGCFLAVYMAVVGGILWLGRGRPRQPLRALAAGALVAAVLIAPVASAFIASRPTVGNRDEGTVQAYSAEWSDYTKPTYSSLVYGRWSWSEGGQSERQLFPRVMPVVLTAVALYPPLSVARIAYAAALLVALDGSLGLNGWTFTALRATLTPFKELRVPARFSILAGMSLAILAGYGAARLLGRWPRQRVWLTVSMLSLVLFEALSQPSLQPVWLKPPEIYSHITGAQPAVLAEFPMQRDRLGDSYDPQYLYFSTFHWQTLVNGYSGFFPPSYIELLEQEREFPSDAALHYLRSRGVEYVAIHGRFTNPVRYRNTVAWLDARSDVKLVAVSPWDENESRLYRIR